MFHIGIDIGGTFTDCVLIGEGAPAGGTYHTAKALSTKGDPADGVLAALAELAGSAGLALPDLLARTERIGHGTTIGTNTVLERTGARVGLVTTAGHGDALAIMRGHGRVAGRSIEDVFAVRGTSLPAPLIVPGAVLELHERVDASGKVVVALDENRATDAIAAFIAEHQLDSVAVALLWSFANPEHELATEKIIRVVAPDVFVSLSSRVSPRLGEFERTVAAVLNGYIGPECTSYLDKLGGRLAAGGLTVPLLLMQSSGGVVPASIASEVALGTLDSGPTAGLTGVAALAAVNGDRGHRVGHRPVHLPPPALGRAHECVRRRHDGAARPADRSIAGRPGQRGLRARSRVLSARRHAADRHRRRRGARPAASGQLPRRPDAAGRSRLPGGGRQAGW